MSYFMILLDNSVVFTGLPSIQQGLGLSPVALSWVQDAYTLVFGGLLLLGARLGDLLGRRRVFVAGLLVFIGASFLIGVAQSGEWLIAARAVQGVGAAIVAPSSLALLTASFPEGEGRSKAVALYGATAGIGASLGLLVGGAAASWISWRAGFLINLPIGVAMVVLAPRYLPETPARRGAFDVPGAVVEARGDDANAAVLALTGGVGVDAALECVGTEQSIDTAFSIARPGSTVGIVGVPHGEVPFARTFFRNVGWRGGPAPARIYIPDLMADVLAGTIEPGRVFDHETDLDHIGDAYTAMDERRSIKSLVRVGSL